MTSSKVSYMETLSRQNRIKSYFSLCEVLPIRKKTIFYHAYRTRIMSGNPLAIFQELLSRPEYTDYQHIWVYGNDEMLEHDTFSRYASLPNVSYVLGDSQEHMEALATCEYLITNAAMPDYWQKREGQVVINTWHGAPLKTLGKHARDFSSSSIANAQRNFIMSDYLVMPNAATAKTMLDAYSAEGLTQAKVLDVGYPRCDLVLNTDRSRIVNLLEKACGHSLQRKKIVLYAPTFRSQNGQSLNSSDSMSDYMLELTNGIPSDYEIFFKVHNTLGQFFKNNDKMLGHLLFDEIETNELLSATDVLITDYSSIFFDYICTGRPILFFDYDKESYLHERGLYYDFDELPGIECPTVESVLHQIDLIRSGSFVDRNRELSKERFAYNDDGFAAKRVVDIVFEGKEREGCLYEQRRIEDNGRTSILISMEDDAKMSAALALFDLLRSLDSHKYRITICAHRVELIWKECERINPEIQIIFSKIAFSKKWISGEFDEAFYHGQYEKFFVGMHFDCYYNLKRRESLIDQIVQSVYPDIDRYWYLRWSKRLSVERVIQKIDRYDDVFMYCSNRNTIQPEFEEAGIKIIDCEQMRASGKHSITVLFLATFDSMNYPMAACAQELEKRGHKAIVLSRKPKDVVNNKMFSDSNIPVISCRQFDMCSLDFVDLVVVSPLKPAAYNRIHKGIRNRSIITCSFSGLFSSITTRAYPDFLLTLGAAKAEELADSHLRYSCIAVGNPQYDALVCRRKTGQTDIKRVLVVDQGGYPYGSKGKQQFADTIVHMANCNPNMEFVVKPRYVPNVSGQVVHNVSEHLYDFITEKPKNLILLDYPTILEDILPDFDAMITLWSTAYLDALMLNIPLILIDGLHSEDVFDVRKQRVKKAYDHLRKTGCLYRYDELDDLSDKFHLVSEEYAQHEVYKRDEPCAGRVVDFFELCFKELIKRNLRPNQLINCNVDEFERELHATELVSADSDRYVVRMRYLDMLNDTLQEIAYNNRCMGEVLDLSSLEDYYDIDLSSVDLHVGRRFLRVTKKEILTRYYGIEVDYFNSNEGKKQLSEDRILQSFYFLLASKLGAIQVIENPPFKVLVPETQCYYLACVQLKEKKYKNAYENLFKFVRSGVNADLVDLLEYRRFYTSLRPFRNTTIHKLMYFLQLYALDDVDVIEYLYGGEPAKSLFASWKVVSLLEHDGADDEAYEMSKKALKKFASRKNKGKDVFRRTGNEALRILIKRKQKKYRNLLDEE